MSGEESNRDEAVVFLVDDDQTQLKILSQALENHNYRVRPHSSSAEFLADYEGEPGCLVLDLGISGLDGFQLQTELSKQRNEIPIIFMARNSAVSDAVMALRRGAVNFLEKPIRTTLLLESIEEAISLDARNSAARNKDSDIRQRIASLTGRERNIFDLLIENEETPSSKAIARMLGISHRTVEHHRSSILEKLGSSSVVELKLIVGKLRKREQ